MLYNIISTMQINQLKNLSLTKLHLILQSISFSWKAKDYTHNHLRIKGGTSHEIKNSAEPKSFSHK